MEIDDPGDMTLELFSMWRIDSLKLFLEKRGLSKEGTKGELAALCFAASKMNIPVKPSSKERVVANMKAYEDLLVVGLDIIPDPFKLCSGWFGEREGMCHWPAIYLSDITKFFVITAQDPNADKYLCSYKTGKAYEYFANNWMKEVHYHTISAKSKYCLIRSQCTPSQRVTDTDHGVWACVEKTTGCIMSAYCSCTAGLGQTCNHVAAMLFRIEHANRMGMGNSAACTSVPCTWTVPGEKVKYGPQQIGDMVPKKSKHGKSASSRPLVSAKKTLFQPISKPSQENQLESLGNALVDILPNACLFKGGEHNPHSTREEKEGIPVGNTDPGILSSNDNKVNQISNTLDDGIQDMDNSSTANCNIPEECYSMYKHAEKFTKSEEEAFFTTLPHLDEREILRLAKETVQQSKSPIWHVARKGRITASRFYAVHTKVNTIKRAVTEPDTNSLLKVLKGESGLSDDPEKLTRAMKHGQEMETVAKKEFYKANTKKHQNLVVDNSGFFIHPEKPFLGASPDLLTSCTCCGKGVVEIKCPVIPPCSKCNMKLCSCPGKHLKCFRNVNGKLSLKENHAYFGQIQGQMAVTGTQFCDFFVYTAYATHQERIKFNSAYWINMSNNLEYFFKRYMIPDMLCTPGIVDANTNRNVVENMETDDVFGSTYFCPLCHQKILENENINSFGARSVCCDMCDKWYHFRCVKMTKSSLKSLGDWLCPTCMHV